MDEQQLYTYATRAQSPADLMEGSIRWIGEHPEAWDAMVIVSQDAHVNGKRINIKGYIEYIRSSSVYSEFGGIKLRNAYSAPFGRILAAWYPELEGSIPMARSKVDGCIIPPMESILGH
jgi:hypothetical protein